MNEAELRDKIAKVIGDELPWSEEDLIDFANRIMEVLPKQEIE